MRVVEVPLANRDSVTKKGPFPDALKEKIMLSNKNFDFKKLSKSIVVYHQMKSGLTTDNGLPFTGPKSRYVKNAMMLSAEDKNMDDNYYNDEIFEKQF